ncbi:hypothetical protein PG985_013513 [Apiospora marii]|uniref:Secreted protein n=1 Tax=Apiospora marii TaxID=335849 RepID=A0ABR1R7J8_9PEZI
MYAKSSLFALCGLATLALGSVVVRPDDPYAFLASEASSYEDLANRVVAFVEASGEPQEPVPSPVVTPAQQEELDELYHSTIVERRDAVLNTRQSRANCGGRTAFAPDMVRCVNYIASLGQQECRISHSGTQMCHDKSAIIYGVSGAGERATPCANVARQAGHIMDVCTQPNQQVGGQGTLDMDNQFNVIVAGAA